MLQAMVASGQWLLLLILIAGSLLAAGYIFRVLGVALQTPEAEQPAVSAPLKMTVTAMVLAVIPLLLGVFSYLPFNLLAVGSPFGVLP
jgi:NADH:ubiquinone oxidoreductase subunit 2 (subunit N)